MDDAITITIPADEDGYILLECPKCCSQFKLTVSDFQSDEVDEIWCPACGLISESFLPNEVIEVARAKALNAIMDEIHSQFTDLERKTRGEVVSIKAGKKPVHEPEPSVSKKLDPFVELETPCCHKSAKLPYQVKESVYYCPFCGGMQYGG